MCLCWSECNLWIKTLNADAIISSHIFLHYTFSITIGNESCTWERRLTPSWVAAPVISILIFCCCCCCRSQHLRQSQSTNQVAANSSNRPPRESNTSIQSQTSAIRRPESPSMESTDLQGSVSTDGNGDTEFSIKGIFSFILNCYHYCCYYCNFQCYCVCFYNHKKSF